MSEKEINIQQKHQEEMFLLSEFIAVYITDALKTSVELDKDVTLKEAENFYIALAEAIIKREEIIIKREETYKKYDEKEKYS